MTPSTLLALAGLVGAGCVEQPEREEFREEPPAAAQDEFNYEDVDDAEAELDESLESLGEELTDDDDAAR